MIFSYIDPGSGYTLASGGGMILAILAGFLGFLSLFFKKFFRFIKQHKIVSLCLALVIITSIITGYFIMRKPQSDFNNKIIVIGFDGLSPHIIGPLMEEGKLPHFSRLKEKGDFRHLSTTNPSQSPVAWAGFATGQNPGKNGVFDFIVRDPKTYTIDLSLSKMINGKPERVIQTNCFWNYTAEKRIPTSIITCPVTYPPDRIEGTMLSGMGVPDILGTEGTFTFYTSEKQNSKKTTGGKVFHVRKAPLMIMNLIGPRVASGGKSEHTTVPFKVALDEKSDTAKISFQGSSISLAPGTWSKWQDVTFKLGLFKKIRGIFKFYLVETKPGFKLYISPINFDPRKPFFQLSYPSDYAAQLAKEIGVYHTQGMPMDTWAVNENRLTEKPFLENVNEVLHDKKEMLNYELNRFKKGLLFCYFESSDIVQHMFWRYIDPKHPLYEKDPPSEYKNLIYSWYQKMDDVLANVMERLGEDDTLIVLSDHGFGTFRRAVHVNTWLKENGYLTLKNPYAESGKELLVDIDWTKTKAYAIGFGAVYINQKGREAQGIVSPGEETEQLKKELVKKMQLWHDDKYDSSIISKVYQREDIFWGENAYLTPDLYIGFMPGYRASWQTALGAVPETTIEDNLMKWSGSHLFDPERIPGILFSNRTITKNNPSILDLAPSLLHLAGFSDEEIAEYDFDGEVILKKE